MSLKSVVVLLLLAAAIAHAAPTPKFNYETMCNRHQLVLNGNALKSGRELRITQAVEERAGSAFQSEAVNVMQDWETVFEYEIKDKDGKGADGFAFVVQSYDPSALSHGASGMGYAGIPGPAMAIEFDTYKNSGLGDPNDNHVSLHTATAGNTLSASETGFHPQPVQMRLDKGATTVTISYDELAHRVTLQFDNGETFTWDDINLGTLFTGEDDAYVGFTASTGGDEEAHVLHSWRFSAQGNGCSGGFSGASCTIDPSELENECGLYKACTQCSQARSCCGWCSDNDDCRREDDNRGCSLDLKCKKDSNKVLWWGIGIVIAVLVLCGIALFVYWRRTRVSRKGNVQDHSLIAQHDDDSANASTADAQYSQL